MTERAEQWIRDWLLGYAWMGTPTERRHEVDCIMAQREWEHLAAQTEHYLAQASGEEHDPTAEAEGFALSALYECHDAPHLASCPRWTEPTRAVLRVDLCSCHRPARPVVAHGRSWVHVLDRTEAVHDMEAD